MCCGKVSYRDELGAKLALANAGAAHRSSRREERRIYLCPHRRWHLTRKGGHVPGAKEITP